MAGTRSAPTVDGSPGYLTLSVKYIDASGDKRSDSYKILATAADIDIEGIVGKLQLVCNASIYEVIVGQAYSSVPVIANAATAVKENVGDNAVIQYKHPTLESFRAYVPSIVDAAFVPGSNNIDPTFPAFNDVILAFDQVIDISYVAVGVRFNERRQLNQQQPV